jgi:diaminopimelate decarboxylase
MYGGQHPIAIHKSDKSKDKKGEDTSTAQGGGDTVTREYIVVGHCCESGDLLTCAPGEADRLSAKSFESVEINDILLVGGSGAYCSSMNAKNYNSFPEAAEVLIDTAGALHLIRRYAIAIPAPLQVHNYCFYNYPLLQLLLAPLFV